MQLASPGSEGAILEAEEVAREVASVQLCLLDGFELRHNDATIDLQPRAQQLLAYLALCVRPVPRSLVASTLWMDTSDHRAQASLRSMLWRLRRIGCLVTERDCGQLQLAPGTAVDVHRVRGQAHRLLASEAPMELGDDRVSPLRGELLPGWWEEWVLVERERLRQLQLHALERLSERLLAAGRVADALDAALSAVAVEPLRESAQRLVISHHLFEGNQSEAYRQYAMYCRVLKDELGVAPSPKMARLVARVTDAGEVPAAAQPLVPSS